MSLLATSLCPPCPISPVSHLLDPVSHLLCSLQDSQLSKITIKAPLGPSGPPWPQLGSEPDLVLTASASGHQSQQEYSLLGHSTASVPACV